MATQPAIDYVIAPLQAENNYQVTKFDSDKGLPLQTYRVVYNPHTGYGRCDCPAAAYRQTGAADKHVKMVAEWLKKQQAQNQHA